VTRKLISFVIIFCSCLFLQLPITLLSVLYYTMSIEEDVALFKHTPLNRSTRNSLPFRLLEIRPCSDFASQIECTIHNANLLLKPSFKALSYVWGDPGLTVPILLNSARYNVTRSCYSALLRLRVIGERRLWIDAICINQMDPDEKSAQIPMMKDIYAAAETIVWLGHPEEEQKLNTQETEAMAFSLLNVLSQEEYRNFDQFLELAHHKDFSGAHWNSVNEILNHSWFTRLWTHQEFILAKSATLVSNYHSLSLSQFMIVMRNLGNAVDQIPAKRLPKYLAKIFADYAGMMGLRRARMRTLARINRDPLRLAYQKISLLDQVDVGRRYHCFSDHDRVYALLGLVDQKVRNQIQVNYDYPVELVYANLAIVLVETSRSLELLANAGLTQGPTSCASWVIDWRADKEEQPMALEYHRYWADCGTIPNFSVSMENLELIIRGIEVDSILTMVIYDKLYDYHHHLSGAKGLKVWKEHFSDYPTGCDPLHAWIRTVTADLGGRLAGVGRINKETLEGFELAHCWDDTSTDAKRPLIAAKEREKDDWDAWFLDISQRFADAVASLSVMRTFFISSKGYMGMGPEPLRVGDLICVILGCSVPLLIRKLGDHHVLVGECFVWGLMDGEALRGRKAKDILDTFRLR
jgi:Heterokaryon incompatibility protein (HET)